MTQSNLQIRTFFDLDAWQRAHGLTLEVYRVTQFFPVDEKFGITSQMRRAASSIGANIAEGFARFHFKDKIRFYHNARGSSAEVQNFSVLARDLNYLENSTCANIIEKCNEVSQLINGLIRSIDRQRP